MAIGKELLSLSEKLGYSFSDLTYLQTALTHTSYTNEMKSRGIRLPSNERLEFLGDAVLELVISEYLYQNFKRYGEGSLTKIRQYLVCEKTLAKVAQTLDLGAYLNLGNGEEHSGCRARPKLLADALEAVFAAVYLDSVARGASDHARVILSVMQREIEGCDAMQRGDYKTALQQFIEKDGSATLEYVIVSETGPEHQKEFSVVAKVNNNVVGEGRGTSIKNAQMQAAKAALSLFGANW